MDRAVGEAALVAQLEVEAEIGGERALAGADDHGHESSWSSSTRPAASASAARPGPPTVRSWSAVSFSRRTAAGSSSRSSRVLAVETPSSVLE